MMEAAALAFPAIDPVIFAIGPFAIRWYALAYIAGILLGWRWMIAIQRTPGISLLSAKQIEDLILWAVAGIMLGGRLGYVFFYKADYYMAHPQEILAVWQGGMSFHGGLLGVIVAFYLYARKNHKSYIALMDIVACAAPIGLFFGRIANFINGELWGRVSDVPWAMVFPHGGPYPRHPSQLYEALLEGLVLFLLLWLMAKCGARKHIGALSGTFLIGYAAARTFIEQFREPDAHLGFVLGQLTMGQLLSLPMLLVGLYLLLTAKRRAA